MTAAGIAFFSFALLLRVEGAPPQKQLIGTIAPDWSLTEWINSEPLTLKDLQGKVVLLRWWTAPGCPYCSATAPALNEFHEEYSDQGLVVIGVYHHKSGRPLRVEEVQRAARKFGFRFPVAVDLDWRDLKRWWLDRGGESWTSVSFLLDRSKRIRWVHPGGQYVKGDRDYLLLKAKIEELLAQPAGAYPADPKE